MNDDLTPLEPETVDELLSAELDGEFDAAARDLGLTAVEATARLRATPGTDARRAALASARELLAAPPELDELLAARLRAKAVRAAEQQHAALVGDRALRRNRLLMRGAGIAAAIAAVVGVAIGISHSATRSDSSAKASANANAAPATVAPPKSVAALPTSALGAFADARVLADAAVGRSRNRAFGSEATTTAGSSVGTNKSATADQAAVPGATTLEQGTHASIPDRTPTHYGGAGDSTARSAGTTAGTKVRPCPVPPEVPVTATPVLRATATLSGKPVIVLVFAQNGEHVVVIQDRNCALVNLQMLG